MATTAALATTTALTALTAAELFDHALSLFVGEFPVAVLVEPLHELGSLFFTRATPTAATAATAAAATTLSGQRFLLLRIQERLELFDVTFVDPTSLVHAFTIGIFFTSIAATSVAAATPRHAAGEVSGHDGNHSRSLTDLLVTLGLSKNTHQQEVLGGELGHERFVQGHDRFEHVRIEIFDFHGGGE